MQIVYATHLPVPARAEASPVHEEVEQVVRSWVHRRLGVEVTDGDGSRDTDLAHVLWSRLSGMDGHLFSLLVDQADSDDPRWRWRTYVDVGREPDGAWTRVRLGLDSAAEGLITRPVVRPGRPGVVRDLVDRYGLTSEGLPLGKCQPVPLGRADGYVAFLMRPDRRMPVVAISEDSAGDTFVDPAHLADRLLGIAHVVHVDRRASFRVSALLGNTLSCFQGAIRIYWPGLSTTDDPYHHRLFVDRSLTFLGPQGLEDELFAELGRLAGLSLGEPKLRQRLKLAAREAEIDALVAERKAAYDRLAQASRAGEGALSAEEFAEFAEEFDQMQARLAEQEQVAFAAELENETLREERDDARRQLIDLVRSLGLAGQSTSDEGMPQEAPATVLEAVQRAQAASPHCVVLPEAFHSAEESQYADPSRVLADLTLVEEIARDWATGDLHAGPNEAFRQRCSGYRDGISDTAVNQYAADYTRTYEGQEILCAPHIARGAGAITAMLRIYLYFDTERRRIVIGHVGRKLRDAGNRN